MSSLMAGVKLKDIAHSCDMTMQRLYDLRSHSYRRLDKTEFFAVKKYCDAAAEKAEEPRHSS